MNNPWYSWEGEEGEINYIDINNNIPVVEQGDDDHQDPCCSTSTCDVFSFWSDDVQQQQEQQQLFHPPNAALPPPQVLESAYFNCHHIPCQTDPVATATGMAIGETSNQESGEHSKRRLKSAQITAHSVSEKRRRDKFKEKIKTLQELLPDCDKTDTASVLDKAVKQIQLLKLQTQWFQELYMASSIRAMSPTPVIPTQQTANVVGMLPYPSMQQMQYPIIPTMQMQMVPFSPPSPLLPVGHNTTSSIGATAGPRLASNPGGPSTQVIGGGPSQLHGGGGGSTLPSSAGGNKSYRGKGTSN